MVLTSRSCRWRCDLSRSCKHPIQLLSSCYSFVDRSKKYTAFSDVFTNTRYLTCDVIFALNSHMVVGWFSVPLCYPISIASPLLSPIGDQPHRFLHMSKCCQPFRTSVDHRHCPWLVVCSRVCCIKTSILVEKKQFLFKYSYFSICPFIYIFVWMHFYVTGTSDRNTFLHQPILILVLYGVGGSTKRAWPGSGNALTSVLRLQKEQWILRKRPCSTRHVCLNRGSWVNCTE